MWINGTFFTHSTWVLRTCCKASMSSISAGCPDLDEAEVPVSQQITASSMVTEIQVDEPHCTKMAQAANQ